MSAPFAGIGWAAQSRPHVPSRTGSLVILSGAKNLLFAFDFDFASEIAS
jgi:hypothetical protein